MRSCFLCKKKDKKGNGSFFYVPKDERRRSKWSEICEVKFSAKACICMDHFVPTDIVRTGRKVFLMPSAVPSIRPIFKMPVPEVTTPLLEPSNVTPLWNDTSDPNLNGFSCPTANSNCLTSKLVGQSDIGPFFTDEPMVPNSSNELTFSQQLNHVPIKDLMESVDFPIQVLKKYTREQATQTDPVILEYTVDRQNYLEKVRKLETKTKDLQLKLAQATAAVDSMRSIFTEGQIRKLMSPGDIKWRWEDISSAICLHASGPRAYNHLYKKGFPLPHVKTLQRWCSKVNVSEGILTTAIDFMRQIANFFVFLMKVGSKGTPSKLYQTITLQS